MSYKKASEIKVGDEIFDRERFIFRKVSAIEQRPGGYIRFRFEESLTLHHSEWPRVRS